MFYLVGIQTLNKVVQKLMVSYGDMLAMRRHCRTVYHWKFIKCNFFSSESERLEGNTLEYCCLWMSREVTLLFFIFPTFAKVTMDYFEKFFKMP